MRFLFIIILLLASALSSCHASHTAMADTAVEEEVSVHRLSGVDSLSSVISLLSTSLRLDLSGLRIDFYPPSAPDSSGTPDIRAAPRSITVDHMSIADSSSAASLAATAMSASDSLSADARSRSDNHSSRTSESEALQPPARWFICSMILVTAMALLTLYFKFWRKK